MAGGYILQGTGCVEGTHSPTHADGTLVPTSLPSTQPSPAPVPGFYDVKMRVPVQFGEVPITTVLKASLAEILKVELSNISDLAVTPASQRRRRLSMFVNIDFVARVPSEGKTLAEVAALVGKTLQSGFAAAILRTCPSCGPITVLDPLCHGPNWVPCVPVAPSSAVGLSNGAIAGIVLGTITFVVFIVGGLKFSGSCQKNEVSYSERGVEKAASSGNEYEMDQVQPRV